MNPSVRSRVYLAIIALLVLVIVVMAYKFIVSGSTAKGEDGRTAILFQSGERTLMLGEMREFVAALQSISDALARDDMKAVARAARAVGTAKAGDVPLSMLAKLPIGFKSLAISTHRGFDAIARDADSGAPQKHTLEQLSGTLQNCVACHASYQIKAAP